VPRMRLLVDKDGLTARQARFAAEYAIDLDGGRALRAAGYMPGKLGGQRLAKSSKDTVYYLLRNPAIRAVVKRRIEAAMNRCEVTEDMILRELWRVAGVDVSKAYNPDGTLRPLDEMAEDVRHAIAGVDMEELFEGRGEKKQVRGYLRKLRVWDKVRALEVLARIKGMDQSEPLWRGRGGREHLQAVVIYLPRPMTTLEGLQGAQPGELGLESGGEANASPGATGVAQRALPGAIEVPDLGPASAAEQEADG